MRGQHLLGPPVQLQGRDGADVLGQVRLPPHQRALPPLVLLDLECVEGVGGRERHTLNTQLSQVINNSSLVW